MPSATNNWSPRLERPAPHRGASSISTTTTTSRARLQKGTEIYIDYLEKDGDRLRGHLQYWLPSKGEMLRVNDDADSIVPLKRAVRIHILDRVTTVDDARRRLDEILKREER
jgi:hypothetical protein